MEQVTSSARTDWATVGQCLSELVSQPDHVSGYAFGQNVSFELRKNLDGNESSERTARGLPGQRSASPASLPRKKRANKRGHETATKRSGFVSR